MALLPIYLVFIVALEGSCERTSNEQQPQIVKARLGENVTFNCASEVNKTLMSVDWKKLNSNGTTERRMKAKGGHLVFENLQFADAGLYECDALFGEERLDRMPLQTFRLEVEVSTCTLRSYSEPNYDNLTSNCSSNGTVRYHTMCSFECDDSFILHGRPLLTCETNDTFDYPLPTCRGSCKMPTLAGALHTNTTTCRSEASIAEGTSCHFYCQSNYKLVGEVSTKCLHNGSLSEHVPSCRPKEELKGARTRSKWWIPLIVVALLIVGAIIGAFSFWNQRNWKNGEYGGVSKDDGGA